MKAHQSAPFEGRAPKGDVYSSLQKRFAASNKRRGLTLIELIVAFTILLILSTMALPVARVKVQREKERHLREALYEIRKAIDRYKDLADEGKLGPLDEQTMGYPPNLDVLVEGVELSPMGSMSGGVGSQNFGTPAAAMGRDRQGMGNQQSAFGGNRGNRSGSGGAFGGGSSFGGSSFGERPGSGRSGNLNRRFDEDSEPQKVRFLRRIPVDPVTGQADWGLRSVQDDPDSMSWGGQNVFDVYSKSMDTALDGTRYSEW